MRGSQVIAFLIILMGSVGCDQVAKQIAQQALEGVAPVSLVGDVLRFELAMNRGAFMSLGQALPGWSRAFLFLVMVPIALLLISVRLLGSGPQSLAGLAGVGLVVGGGLGNWLDRLLQGGAVTDFVSVGVGSLRSGIFNLADVFVLAGVTLLFLSMRNPPPADAQAQADT